MKRIYRLAWLTLLLGLFTACTSPPTGDLVVEEAAEPAAVEAEPVAVDPTSEPDTIEVSEMEPTVEMEEEVEVITEEEMIEEDHSDSEEVVTAVDGPTHTPAATIEDALVERAYDQVKGADEPLLTIIEYGDFQ